MVLPRVVRLFALPILGARGHRFRRVQASRLPPGLWLLPGFLQQPDSGQLQRFLSRKPRRTLMLLQTRQGVGLSGPQQAGPVTWIVLVRANRVVRGCRPRDSLQGIGSWLTLQHPAATHFLRPVSPPQTARYHQEAVPYSWP